MTDRVPDYLMRLPPGIRSRCLDGVNGLRMHVLEAGWQVTDRQNAERPLLLLLHGFPELAWSWRKVMPALAQAGFHVVAPDQRGYGHTTGWVAAFDLDPAPFCHLNLAQDALALVSALGRTEVHAVIGHDFGSPVAAVAALTRPEVFRRLVMMSAPFSGAARPNVLPSVGDDVHAALRQLPRPRKHYQWHYASRSAEPDWLHAPQGLHAMLRAYYHVKSADWAGNRPHPLRAWSATELAQLPDYYMLAYGADMAATVAPWMPSAAEIAACAWLPDDALAVYADAFSRTGMQGGLNWYRCNTNGRNAADLRALLTHTITVPALFIAGAADWGVHQSPGAFDGLMQVCADLRGRHLVPGAGHWVQQEQPQAVIDRVLAFLRN